MNEEVKSAPPGGIEQAPAAAIEPGERPVWRPEELRGADLRGQDLTDVEGLLPEQLAGADLTGARLPDEIARFPALAQVTAISSEARKIFIGLLAACVYSWLVIGTTTDVALVLNTASSPLPIINTRIPIAGFYVVGAALLAAVYCYFHFYLQRLWRTLATLPAVFPDGTALDDKTDPWLLTNLVRTDFERLRANAPPLVRVENLLSIMLVWSLVPLTLLALWGRYLPARDWLGTTWLVLLIGVITLFGRHTYRLARAVLRAQSSQSLNERDGDHRVLRRAWHELRRLHPDKVTVGLIAVLIVCSLSAFHDNPRDPYTWVAKGLNTLNFAGIRTYANLREVEVAHRPEGWDGRDWSKVMPVNLRGRNLAFADLTRAFLVNADLRGADLTEANLTGTQLRGADLEGALLRGADLADAQLQNTHLRIAQLQGANLAGTLLKDASRSIRLWFPSSYSMWPQLLDQVRRTPAVANDNTQLQGADLSGAQLQGADLRGAELQGVNLIGAQLQGADLSGAQLQGADLRYTHFQGADLGGAHLQGADLEGARLQGVDLTSAVLKGANLAGADLWRAKVGPDRPKSAGRWWETWEFVDLRGSSVDPMTDRDTDELIAAAAGGIPDDTRREVVVGKLTAALRANHRTARPEFPRAWESEPNVMFRCYGAPVRCDLGPETSHWGPPRWVTEEAYQEALAEFLGDLACGPGAPEALTQALARRALEKHSELTVHRGGWRTHGRPYWMRRAHPFAPRLANRLMASSCPPGQGMPADMRRQLEQLASEVSPTAIAPPNVPPLE